MPNHDEQPEHLLIIKLGAFGDVIIAQNKIKLIREKHPEARITVLTGPGFAEMMRRNPAVDHVLTDARPNRIYFWRLLKTRSTLRKLNPDRVYDLQHSSRTRLYRRWLGEALPWEIMIDHLPGEGLVEMDWLPEQVDALLTEHDVKDPFVLLVPGCSARNAYKRWPYYAELIDKLQAIGYPCVTAPGPDEIEVCEVLPATMLVNQTTTGPRPLSIPQLAGLAKRAAYAIGNDTGPTHLCAFTGTPGIAIFGPFTSPEQVGINKVWPAIQVERLDQLTVEQVLDYVRPQLPPPH